MVFRALVAAVLIFAATVIDHALPVMFHSLPVLPSLLDLALLLVCLHLNPSESVFWAGIVGLLHANLTGTPLGQGIVIAATLALICQQVMRPQRSGRSLLDVALLGGVLLTLLLGFRIAGNWVTGQSGPEQSWPEQSVLILILGRMAATFLLFLIVQSLGTMISFWRSGRQTFHADVA